MKLFSTLTKLFLLAAFNIFAVNTFAQIDTAIGVKTPSGKGSSYQQLAHALCDGLSNDYQKANAIYNWITHNISYDVKAMQQGKLKEEDPKKVFKQKKGMCSGYSLLFAAMCNEVGVKAIVIDGYSKDWMFDDGDKFYIPRHAWNVVYIDHKWRPVDATWGAGGLSQVPGWLKRQMSKAAKSPLQTSGKLKFRFQYDTAYFLSDPLVFRIKHLPSDPIWQLTDTAMPLQVFEAGETAIRQFNKQYPELADNLAEQEKLANMDDDARMQASASRMSAYNARFRVAMAAKHQADAIDTIAANANGGGAISNSGALASIQEKLKDATDEVNEQGKSINTEYAALNTKNKTKNQLAKQYIQSLHSDNKRMIAQCESYIKRAGTLTTTIKRNAGKANDKNKKVDPDKLSGIPTAQKQTSVEDITMRSIEDSVSNRKNRIDSLQQIITKQQAQIKATKEANGNKLDTLAPIFVLADSALIEETINRIRMHDNYDEEVLQWNRIVKTVRLQQVDSLQKDYFAAYDSVNNQYKSLRQNQWEQIQQYHKNMKDMERYKRRNNNTVFLAQYYPQVKELQASTMDYYQALADHQVFVEKHKELFKLLIKLYKRQEELAGYMEKSEEKRKELEDKNLAKKEAFDKKENETQKQNLKQTGEKAEKMLSSVSR